MERLDDGVLGFILYWVDDPNDKQSFSLVCKRWLGVQRLNQLSLRVLQPNLVYNFLPRFPYLVTFESPRVITNADIEFVAKTCPNIKVLNLDIEGYSGSDQSLGLDDVDDCGICAIGTECRNLTEVFLKRRWQITNVGVVSLVQSARNLTVLDLGWCLRVTDQALEAIGAANSLEALNLQGCFLITDKGLASLANGLLSRTLKKLSIADCNRITDVGVVLFSKQMCCLEELNLADCGPRVTDVGGVAISAIRTLKRVDFSRLDNISDVTVLAIAINCQNLEAIYVK